MLSRTAENLFWLARYVERAENMARLMEMGYRMSLIPASEHGFRGEWGSVLSAAGSAPGFAAEHGDEQGQKTVAHYLLFDRANPSSVTNCLQRARDNGRAVRTALTLEMWEALNEGWIEWQQIAPSRAGGGGLADILDWIKKHGARFRGATDGSVLRLDGYAFLGLGSAIERADNTARLLDVKNYVLLPASAAIGGGRDHYQWVTVLRAASSLRAYHWVYRSDYSPAKIAHFLILNEASPRSLAHCYRMLGAHMDSLARLYGLRHRCHLSVAETIASLADARISEIFERGMHEFLTAFIARNAALSEEIARAFDFGN